MGITVVESDSAARTLMSKSSEGHAVLYFTAAWCGRRDMCAFGLSFFAFTAGAVRVRPLRLLSTSWQPSTQPCSSSSSTLTSARCVLLSIWIYFHSNFLPDDQDDDGCLVCALVCVHECRQGGLSLLRRKPEGCAVIVNCRLQFALIFLYTARGALAAACYWPGIHSSSC